MRSEDCTACISLTIGNENLHIPTDSPMKNIHFHITTNSTVKKFITSKLPTDSATENSKLHITLDYLMLNMLNSNLHITSHLCMKNSTLYPGTYRRIFPRRRGGGGKNCRSPNWQLNIPNCHIKKNAFHVSLNTLRRAVSYAALANVF